MMVDPIKQHWTEGLITHTGERLFFIPLNCLMDMPEKEK
jgi:hypothetical protein